MLERLWSGWRASYVSGAFDEPERSAPETSAKAGSVFTRILESGMSDDETFIVAREKRCFAIVNIHPYTSGHLLVVPYREAADLEDLEPEESADLWSVVGVAVRAVRHAYRPEGLNVGLNLGRPSGGSVPDHLHVHVVPRWTGDSNFMSSIGNTQTLPETLEATTSRLRAAWSHVTAERPVEDVGGDQSSGSES